MNEYAIDDTLTLQRVKGRWIVLNDESALQVIGDVFCGTLPDCRFAADEDALGMDAYAQREFCETYYSQIIGD